MNANAYNHNPDRSLTEPTTEPAGTGRDPAPLAVHRDPSQHAPDDAATQRPRNGIAWVRPSDLPTMIGSRVIGRGLDLKAELVRRANRPSRPKPPKARVTKTAIAEPGPPSITHQRMGAISL